ncbi:MAG: rhomboid family intramembrane serine protease [Bacteroidales bacterium]|nr:rhomboid family intramembrane serine protease [Bacteroidales bacterium]
MSWFALKRFFNQKTVLSNLIFINVTVFLIINVVGLMLFLFNLDQSFIAERGVTRLTYWLSLPADLKMLITKPWTLITYMFVQEGLLHLLFNILVLYIGGQIFTNYLSQKMLLSTYFLGGISGAFLYILAFNLFPVFSTSLANAIAFGSSASVLAIFIASAARAPQLPMQVFFFGQVPLKYIAIVIIALDVLNIRNGNAGGHIAHLGGALYGFLFIQQLKKGKNTGRSFENIPMKQFFNRILSWFKKPKHAFKNVYSKPRATSDEDFLRKKAEEQAEIDLILEKIKKSGYSSLSSQEKTRLFDASKK